MLKENVWPTGPTFSRYTAVQSACGVSDVHVATNLAQKHTYINKMSLLTDQNFIVYTERTPVRAKPFPAAGCGGAT